MPCRAMSIIPLDVEAPINMPIAATSSTILNLAALAPTAGERKLTASFATPTLRSKTANTSRKPRIPRYMKSIKSSLLLVENSFRGKDTFSTSNERYPLSEKMKRSKFIFCDECQPINFAKNGNTVGELNFVGGF